MIDRPALPPDKATQLMQQAERFNLAPTEIIQRRLSQPPKSLAVRSQVQPTIESVMDLGHYYPVRGWVSGERTQPIIGETFSASFRNAAVATNYLP